MPMKNFIRELKRRRVFNIVGSYAVVAWLIIQVVATIEEPLGLPAWADTITIISLLLGFPVCAMMSWYYDLTSQGIEKTTDITGDHPKTVLTARDRLTMIFCVIAVAGLLVSSGYLVAVGSRDDTISVAVLPFNTDQNEELQYLGDGVRDSLITRLSRLQSLRIKTANIDQFSQDPVETGRSLGVDYVNFGRIERSGDTYEVVTDLIDVSDGSLLWRERFSTSAVNMLEIETSIAGNIARQLGLGISAQEASELARVPTANPAAHRLYLQGRYFWNRRTPAGFENSINYYTEALALDPNYALAHAGLAQTNLMLLGWGLRHPDDVAPQIVAQAEQAIRLDPTLAEPHAALGYYHTIHSLDWEQARNEFLQAIQLNSNYSSAHHWYAFLLMTLGNMDAAIEEILLARELEPLSPIINAEVGYFFIFDRQYERAVTVLENALALDDNFLSTIQYLARAYIGLGQVDQAREYIERWRILSPDNELLGIVGAMLLPKLGLEEEARQIYAAAVIQSRESYIMPGVLGITAAALGDFDAATVYIETGLAEGSMVMSWLRDPLLEAFHQDPRYTEIMRRAGLQP